MKKALAFLTIWFCVLGGFAGRGIYLMTHPEIVYKCPSGQVTVLEDEGYETQAVRCYTPGVRYNDIRPISEKKIDHWKEKEK